MKKYPSKSTLNALFEYRDGHLYWLVRPSRRQFVGDRAGGLTAGGYWRVKYEFVTYLAHRVIWIMHNGAIPASKTIDHINRKTADNRIENLRLATASQQRWNIESGVVAHKHIHLRIKVLKSGRTARYYSVAIRNGAMLISKLFTDDLEAAIKYRDEQLEKRRGSSGFNPV